MVENVNKSINFYAIHDCKKSEEYLDYCISFEKSNNLDYPCLILLRVNSWNDYSYYSHFSTFYFENNGECHDLGNVKIIQYHSKDLYTSLPNSFKELPKDEFFSRGTLQFYNNLKLLGIKETVLSSINDIHYNDYGREYVSKIGDGTLIYAYEQSLFRDDFYDLEVSSEYAKNSLEMLKKIENCVSSLSELDEENIEVLRNLLYGSVITSLESYLGDAFKYHVINNENYFYSFLKNYDFPSGEKKYNLSELGLRGNDIGEFIKDKVKEIMNNIIFHKIKMTKELYKKILNIELPGMLMGFQEDIQKRHDIFHRNGKNIAGIDINVTNRDVRYLIEKVKKFIGNSEHILETKTP